jgi:oligopeptidase B
MEADFRSTRLPLLNRGIVYVIAHIRGGGEMGRQWYEEPNGAKYLCKKNTFNDFVDVANWLVCDRVLTIPAKMSCEGRSAGGLLIGSSLNQAPHLFKVAILGVPFVDVVCTMVDASIPLTVVEWEEWGNPNEEKYYQYMMEYCPMQTIRSGGKYPACLLTGGLHDPRVQVSRFGVCFTRSRPFVLVLISSPFVVVFSPHFQFWEPAKFAASLRHAQDPASGPVCVKMDMSAGHFSASDRYKYLKELAFDYAFLLDQLGI